MTTEFDEIPSSASLGGPRVSVTVFSIRFLRRFAHASQLTFFLKLSSATFFLLLAFPTSAFAQVVVSEIMYDLAEGSDTGREWIEVFNSGGSDVNLTTWKLFEAETNHKITEVSGGVSLAVGAYAVIADNSAKFLIDYPSYSGLLFDSAFSLNNAGETLILRDADFADRDAISYTTAMGGAGDGRSLQRTSVGAKTFTAAAPSPGTGTLVAQASGDSVGEAPPSTDNASGATQDQTQQNTAGGSLFLEPQMFAYAGKDRMVIVGADTVFEGQALSKDGEPLKGGGVRFLWTFGDGSLSEGRSVFHHFAHPGKYAVVLTVSSAENSGTARITVTADPAQFALSALQDGSAEIKNKSGRELDLSFWHVKSGENRFLIPENTLVLKNEKVIIPPAILGFNARADFTLLYPNGTTASAAGEENPAIRHVSTENALQKAQKEVSHAEVPAAPDQEVGEKKITTSDDTWSNESQVATAVYPYMDTPNRGIGKEKGFINTWTLGFIALLALGGTGALFAARSRRVGWDIVEEA